MRRLLCAVATAALVLLLAVPAGAYEGERAPTAGEQRVINVLEGLTVRWFPIHYPDTPPCASPDVIVAESLLGDDGVDAAARGTYPEHGCRVYLRADLLESVLDRESMGPEADVCEAYLHERGHNAGLQHTGSEGLMRDTIRSNIVPECTSWANRVMDVKERRWRQLNRCDWRRKRERRRACVARVERAPLRIPAA